MVSQFVWRSDSPITIFVNRLTGFKISPDCGVLHGPATSKSLDLPPQSIPLETTVTWWKGTWTDREKSKIHEKLITIPVKPKSGRKQTLVFTYTEEGDGGFSATWEDSKIQ